MKIQFTALIEKEDDLYLARCPELDITSQGESVQSARENLRLAVEQFLEVAPVEEVERRLRSTPDAPE